MSDIDTAAASSLKVLDPKRPIREVDIKGLAGAGVPEITPEMIAVGANLICRHFYDVVAYPSSVEELAAEVYRAMEMSCFRSPSAQIEKKM